MDDDDLRDVASAVIRAESLTRRYGVLTAVDGLDLTIQRGEIYGFLGPNGAGKTSTIRMLLGILRPTAGTVEVLGGSPSADPFRVKRRVGVVAEQPAFYDDLSAWESLAFHAALYRLTGWDARAAALIERLGLAGFERLRAVDYSRGMRQKLALARALLHRPELLVLDEPVSGLDPHGIRQVRELLLEENAAGVSIVLSSHILSEVERTAHRVGILSAGRLAVEGPVSSLLRPGETLEDVFVRAT
ncbi:MAG: ABC transporter ATP-binding protein [Deltaproteobacteria bacterium]|nr:ABC transporter ATP-binding protein [Deltaproteobacteria bacterium]